MRNQSLSTPQSPKTPLENIHLTHFFFERFVTSMAEDAIVFFGWALGIYTLSSNYL